MTARFLIEVPHEATTVACARVVNVFLRTGSHFSGISRAGESRAAQHVYVEGNREHPS